MKCCQRTITYLEIVAISKILLMKSNAFIIILHLVIFRFAFFSSSFLLFFMSFITVFVFFFSFSFLFHKLTNAQQFYIILSSFFLLRPRLSISYILSFPFFFFLPETNRPTCHYYYCRAHCHSLLHHHHHHLVFFLRFFSSSYVEPLLRVNISRFIC